MADNRQKQKFSVGNLRERAGKRKAIIGISDMAQTNRAIPRIVLFPPAASMMFARKPLIGQYPKQRRALLIKSQRYCVLF